MIQGTTPTFLFKFSVSLDLILEWRIGFFQEGKENIIKTSQECIIDENQVIYVKLSQEETFAFETNKYVKLQAKALTKDNNVIPSQTLTLTVGEMLDKVLFEIENTPPTKIDTSIIEFKFDTEPCGFGLDFEDLYIEKVSGGGDISVDESLSLFSTNPVQNKVVTKAINEVNESLKDKLNKTDVDNALSIDSEKPVQNKVITNALGKLNEDISAHIGQFEQRVEDIDALQGQDHIRILALEQGKQDKLTETDKQEFIQQTIENIPVADKVEENNENFVTSHVVNEALNSAMSNVADNFANALKSSAGGTLITVSDVSPIQHIAKAKLIQKNLANLKYAEPLKSEVFDIDGNNIVIKAQGQVYGIKFPQKYLKLEIGKTYTASVESLSPYTSSSYGWRVVYTDGSSNPQSSASNTNNFTFTPEKEVKHLALYASSIGSINNQQVTIKNIQIENSESKTTFTPHINPTNLSVKRYGATETDNLETFTANEFDVAEIPTLSPTMTVTTDNANILNIQLEYNTDTNKVIGDVAKALKEIISLQEQYINGGTT